MKFIWFDLTVWKTECLACIFLLISIFWCCKILGDVTRHVWNCLTRDVNAPTSFLCAEMTRVTSRVRQFQTPVPRETNPKVLWTQKCYQYRAADGRAPDGAAARRCIVRILHYAFTRWQHFSAWNDVMAAILKVRHQIEKPIPSINPYLLKNIPVMPN